MDVLILGCGFTGRRVARRMLARGARVLATSRSPHELEGVEWIELADIPARLTRGALVLHSIPPEGSRGAVELLGDKPARVVYLSSTAVYGAATVVNETTPADASSERARARLEVENEALSGRWLGLVLRPAAIYGPGRGTQERVKRGEFNLNDAIVSRIHVEDLAAHVEAALLSQVTGVYPAADDAPCSSREITEFCASLLGLRTPAQGSIAGRVSGNRRVDGSAIRELLGVTLRYPSYREGIPAALREGRESRSNRG